MKLNVWFDRDEFACKCGCGFDTVDASLLELLTDIRDYFGKPVTINSACRCESHNASVGGKPSSQHLLGRAADITVKGVSPDKVHEFVIGYAPLSLGIGKYVNFTHVDTRNDKARW